MQDFSLQGKVFLGANVAGKPGAMRWVNDAGLLQIGPTNNQEQRQENFSGLRHTSATMNTSLAVSFSLTLRAGTAENLALGLYGEHRTVAADSLTGEAFPAGLVAGDIVLLDRGNISALTIEDDAASPLTLGTHYRINDPVGAEIEILDPAALVQPFVADYDHGGSSDVTLFTQQPPVRYLMMNGLNTVDGSTDRVRVRLYRLKFNPIGQLDLINNTFAELALTGTALIDVNNQADPALGLYGRIELLDEE